MRNTLIGQENILSFCKKMFFTAFLIQLMNISSFAQNKDVDVNIVFEKTIKHDECRYCQAKARQTFLTKVYFEDDKYKGAYDVFLRKLEAANLAGNFLKSSELPKVCDMSRTGNHGVESYNEKVVETQSFSFSRLVEALEEKKKEDEQQRNEAEQQALTKKEQERVLKLNKSIIELYDSLNYCYEEVKKSGNGNLFNKMLGYNSRITALIKERENENFIYISKRYEVIIPAKIGGMRFFSFKDIHTKLLWSRLFIYDFKELVNVIEVDQSDKESSLNDYRYSEIQAWAYLGLGNIDSAYAKLFEYLKEIYKEKGDGNTLGDARNNIDDVLCQETFLNDMYARLKNEEVFTCKNRALLMAKLMEITLDNNRFLFHKWADYKPNAFKGELTISEVMEILDLPEKNVKKLVKQGLLKSNELTSNISATSVLNYFCDVTRKLPREEKR